MAEPPLVAVLAAGSARRFGGGKLDVSCAGRRLGSWALEAVGAAGLPPGIIVVGEPMPLFAAEAKGWRTAINPRAAEGLGTSVALAGRQALADGRDLLIVLADMPLVEPAHLLALSAGGPAATRHCEGRAGVPAFVSLHMVDSLADLGGDQGAGPLLARLPGLRLLDAPPATLVDVDRPDDLQAVEAALSARARA